MSLLRCPTLTWLYLSAGSRQTWSRAGLALAVLLAGTIVLAGCNRGGGSGNDGGNGEAVNPLADEMPVIPLDPEVGTEEVALPFVLWGEDGSIEVEILVSRDGGETFRRASTSRADESNPGLFHGAVAGAVGLFHWDAVGDFGAALHEQVAVRFVQHSGRGRGEYGQTDVFTLDLRDVAKPFRGYLLDGALQAVEGVRVENVGTGDVAHTGADGAFELPVFEGAQALLTLRGGSGLVIVAAAMTVGMDETGRPFIVSFEDVEHRSELPPDQDATLIHPDWPGLTLTVPAGAATFPDGSHGGLVSLSWVNPDDLPVAPPSGEFPLAAVAIGPAGLSFKPGVPMSLPSPILVKAGSQVTLWRLGDDSGVYQELGPATIGEDGNRIEPGDTTWVFGSGTIVATIEGFETHIKGRVIDGVTEGIAGAWVFVAGHLRRAGSDGAFRLRRVAAGFDEILDGEVDSTYRALLDVRAIDTDSHAEPPVSGVSRGIEPELGAWTGAGREISVTDAGEFLIERVGPEVTIERLAPLRPDGRLASRSVEVWGTVSDLDETGSLEGTLTLGGRGFQVKKTLVLPGNGPFVVTAEIPDEAFPDRVLRSAADLAVTARVEAGDEAGHRGHDEKEARFPIHIALETMLPAAAPAGTRVALDFTAGDIDWGVRSLHVLEYHGSPEDPRREFVQKLTFSGEGPSGALPPRLDSVLPSGPPTCLVPEGQVITLVVRSENGLGLVRRATYTINGGGEDSSTRRRRITGHIAGASGEVALRLAASYTGGVQADGTIDLQARLAREATTIEITFLAQPPDAFLPVTVSADVGPGPIDLGTIEIPAARRVEGKVVGLGVGPLEGVFVWIEAGKAEPVATGEDGRFSIAAETGDVLVRIRPPYDGSFLGASLFVPRGAAGKPVDLGRIVLAPILDPPLVLAIDPEPFGAGEPIAVRGRGFGTEAGALSVHLGSLTRRPDTVRPSSLSLATPSETAAGSLWIVRSGLRSNKMTYRMRPYVKRVDPNPQAAPGEFSIEGAGFASKRTNNKVTIAGTQGTVGSASPTRLRSTVPREAVTGLLRVRARGQVSNPRFFKVRPAINSVEPANPSPLQIMTVRGSGFHAAQGATILRLAGDRLDARITTKSMQVRLPLEASTGDLVVVSHGVKSAAFALTLSTTRAIGRVEDHLGSPVSGAAITLHGEASPGDGSYFELTTTTRSDGSFEIPGAPTIELLEIEVHDESKGYVRETTAGPLEPVAFGQTDFGRIVFAPRDWPLLPCPTVPTGREPVAVALGDLNGDGLEDIVSANIWSDDVSVRLARDHFQPRTIPPLPVGQDPWDLTLADIDEDTDLDIVVTDRTSDDLAILVNHGDGTFEPARFVSCGREPLGMASGDLDRDGHLDLVVSSEVDDGVSVLLGHGDGTFGAPLFTAVGNAPQRLAVADLDGDRRLDVVTANFTSDNVTVLIGRGDGAFDAPRHLPAGMGPMAVQVGDTDGDGHPDLVTANAIASTISVLLGHGDGSFYPAVSYMTGLSPTDLAVLDLDGDGRLDVATANAASNDVTVLVGMGDGAFGEPIPYLVGNQPAALASGRVDDDERPDLVTANRFADRVAVLLAERPGVFRAPFPVTVAATPGGLTLRDMDGDGIGDLVVPDIDANVVTVNSGRGDGTFRAPVSYPAGLKPDRLTVPDLDDDGLRDIVVLSASMSRCTVLMQQNDRSFVTLPYFSLGSQPVDHAHRRLDGDRYLDLVVACAGDHTVEIYRGRGDGTFTPATTLATGREPRSLELADMDRDGAPDIIVANGGDGTVSIWHGDGSLGFNGREDIFVGVGPDWLEVADFNGDGWPDAAVSHPGKDRLSVMLNQGDGTLGDPVTYPAGHTPVQVWAADTNVDGVQDLVAGNLVTRDLTVLIGTGDGAFREAQFYASGNQPGYLWIGDLNDDGAPDIVTSDPVGGVLIHLNQTLR